MVMSNEILLAEVPDSSEELELVEVDTHQFVTFSVGSEFFAVDMAPVQEIIRVPDTVRVPLAPAALEGLSNLRGKVLPIVSLRRIFGFDEREPDDAMRALVIDFGQALGFVVDRVSSVVEVDPASIESVDSISSTISSDLLLGVIKDVANQPMIMVLDFARLIAREFDQIAELSKTAAGALGATVAPTDDDDQLDDELQLVSFNVANQEYAIAIEDVQEIVQIPEDIIHVPHAEAHVLGIMTLRQRLLPLVSLRRMFELPPRDVDERSRIVVVSLGGDAVGVVMDNVNEVLRVARDDVDVMPGLLLRDDELGDIPNICRLEDGKRLVSIISAVNLFKHSTVREALKDMEASQGNVPESDLVSDEPDENDDDEQVVVFCLGKEEFGVPIESVQEIVRVPEQLTHVPKAPAFVEGVINLRGSVLPVLDLRRRLGLASIERTDRQRVMVFLIGGVRTGFIVDSVAEVLRVNKTAIEVAPRLSSAQARLLARMANLEAQKRMVQLIDPSHLVEREELDDLLQLAA